ncbi:MAG: GNAT family N-acetyltransferase [Bacteroidota bacterium]
MNEIAIVPALESDHESLSALCKRSKAFWGYSPEQMKAWDEDLTISASFIQENIVMKALQNGQLIGFYSLVQKENEVWLDDLFIDPSVIGKGIGSILLEEAYEVVLKMEMNSLLLEADPHAEAFYLKKGFERVGEHASSIPGRVLPVMRKEVG